MPDVREWVDPAGVPVRILTRRSRGTWRDRLFAAAVMWQLWRERRNYDVVYFLMQGLHLAAGLPMARLLHKPVCMKFGGSNVIPLLPRSFVGRIELAWLRRWARRILVLNPGMADEARQHGIPESQLLWMPNPCDPDEFRPADAAGRVKMRRKFGIPDEAPVLLYVGRLSPEKGISPLLKGFSLLTDLPHAMLVLLGDGPLRKELEAESSRLGIPDSRIRFAGRVPAPEVAKWLQIADVFTLLSPSEGFSCALEEAMAAGLASVVTDIPANSQLIEHNVDGLLAPVDNPEAAAEAFHRLLADPQARQRMGAAARQKILDNYTLDRVCDRYEALFREMLAE